MKTVLLAVLIVCLLSAGCGGGSGNSKSSPPTFLNGPTLATATSYWTGSCAITQMNGKQSANTIDLEFTNDGGAESTFAGSSCKGTYSLEALNADTISLAITTSCSENSNYVVDLINPNGSIRSGSFQVASGTVFEGSDLALSGFNGSPCEFSLVKGQQ
jgi:hypothetical protein